MIIFLLWYAILKFGFHIAVLVLVNVTMMTGDHVGPHCSLQQWHTSREGHTLILTTLVIFVTTGTTLNQACGYNQICSCQIQNSSESVIFTGIQTHCSAVVGLGLETQITLLVCIHPSTMWDATSCSTAATVPHKHSNHSNIKIFVICSNIKIFDHTWRYKYTQSLFQGRPDDIINRGPISD